jgi:hypothetical protein
LRKACTITFTLVFLVGFSSAQIPRSGNGFFGYSFSRGQAFGPATRAGIDMHGWEGTLEGKFLPWLGGVADFDWHYGGVDTNCVGLTCTSPRFHLTTSRHSVLFGPRASTSIGRYTPFAQFLLGFTYQTDTGGNVSNSDLAFSDGAGAGLDYKIVNAVAWRLQADWIHTRIFRGTQNDLRISTGIVFRF